MLKGLFKNRENKFDIHICVFFVHLLLINASYVAFTYGSGMQALVKATRAGLLGVGLVLIGIALSKIKLHKYLILILIGFFILNIPPIVFSYDVPKSIEQFTLLFPFIIYLGLFVLYMNSKNGNYWTKYKLLSIIRIAFIIPVLSFCIGYLTGNVVIDADTVGRSALYGVRIGFFASNQAAWSSIIVIAITLDLLSANVLSKTNRLLSILFMILCASLIILTAARVSMAGLGLVGFLYILFNKNLKPKIKLGIIFSGFLMIVIAALSISEKQLDTILTFTRIVDKRKTRTATKRSERVSIAFNALLQNEKDFLFGFGLGNYERAIEELYQKDTGNLHNSYVEILSNTGFICGTFFFLLMFGRAFLNYIRNDFRTITSFLILILIAGTENNYGAGQFIFIPWFTIILLYIVLDKQNSNIKLNNIF